MPGVLKAIIVIAALLAVRYGAIVVMRHYLVRGALSAHRYAVIFVGRFTLMVLVLYFGGLIASKGLAAMLGSPELIGLGFGIALLNLLIGYPIAYYFRRARLYTENFARQYQKSHQPPGRNDD